MTIYLWRPHGRGWGSREICHMFSDFIYFCRWFGWVGRCQKIGYFCVGREWMMLCPLFIGPKQKIISLQNSKLSSSV